MVYWLSVNCGVSGVVIEGQLRVSIKGIDQHLTAGAFITRDVEYL